MNAVISLPPYALALDMVVFDDAGDAPVIAMPFADKVQGRPGFLHGGAISGLLEMAAVAAIYRALQANGSDASIDESARSTGAGSKADSTTALTSDSLSGKTRSCSGR